MTFNHVRHKQPRQVHHGFAVHADLRKFLLDGRLHENAKLAEAGVIDEDIDGDSRALGGVVNLLRRFRIAQVGYDNADFGSTRCKFLCERFKAIPATCREDQFCSAPCQLVRQNSPEVMLPNASPGTTWGAPGLKYFT